MEVTYSHDISQETKVGQIILDVLKVDFSSSEGTSALLPAWVLAADSL